ncbi:unnamed protein product [Mucor hiemalis]
MAIGPGLTEKIREVFDSLVACPSNDADLVRAEVSKMKADLLVVKDHDKELVKILDVLDYVIMNFEAKSSKESELTSYRKTACVLDILFRSTPLQLIDGEHSSEATKDARNVNMRAVDDDGEKKDLIGRKIDLIIKGSGVEMSSLEWKKPATTAKVIEQQRIKNIRTNSVMLHNLSKLVHHDNLFLLGMDWVGFIGVMFALIQVSDVHCVNIVGELVLPQTMNILEKFKDTLDLLYLFKQHNLNLLDVVTPFLERKAIENQLKMMTGSYKKPPVRHAPTTFFTPKKKRERNN